MVPQDLKYTDQHEWIRLDDNVATVGITDHAQQALGDITFVEAPTVGDQFAQGDEVCALESCKAAAGTYAPAGGKITEANAALEADPGLVNTDCYGDGWIYKIAIIDTSELSKHMTADQYAKFLTDQE